MDRSQDMFRITAIIICVLLTFSISSCTRPEEFLDDGSTKESIASLFPDYEYDSELAQTMTGYRAAAAEKGYFFAQRAFSYDYQNPMNDIRNDLLYFYDIDTEEPILLCTNASCTHNSPDCKAFLYDGQLENVRLGEWTANCIYDKIFYYEGHLYMLTRDENWDAYLCLYDQGHMDEERIAQLTDSTGDPRILITEISASLIHDGWYYYLLFEYDNGDDSSIWIGRDTTFTLCRVRLKKGSAPEELFSFSFPGDYNGFYAVGSGSAFRIIQSGDNVYCIAATSYRDDQTKNQVEQRLIRYNEAEGAKLLWEYSGNDLVNLLGAEGKGPVRIAESFIDEKQTLYYTSDLEDCEYAEYGTAISCLNMETGETKVLYRTPYDILGLLRTDGEYCYFFEATPTRDYLAAIDREGNLIRRYEFEFTDEQEEHRKIVEENDYYEPIPESLKDLLPEDYEPERWRAFLGHIELLVSDSRYLMLKTDYEGYKAFLPGNGPDSKLRTAPIGLIRTEDFLAGKEVVIRQINGVSE